MFKSEETPLIPQFGAFPSNGKQLTNFNKIMPENISKPASQEKKSNSYVAQIFSERT